MNEQEFERKMAFIVDQQAQFGDIEELKETQVETAITHERRSRKAAFRCQSIF